MRFRRLWAWAGFTLAALGAPAALPSAEAAMHTSTAQTRRGVVATIEGQLAAFRAHSPEKAYQLAAAPLRQQLPLPTFTEIVHQNYPEIWDNARATYGIVQDDGSRATLTVRVFAAAGNSAAYDYILFLEGENWRIAGVLRHEIKPASGA